MIYLKYNWLTNLLCALIYMLWIGRPTQSRVSSVFFFVIGWQLRLVNQSRTQLRNWLWIRIGRPIYLLLRPIHIMFIFLNIFIILFGKLTSSINPTIFCSIKKLSLLGWSHLTFHESNFYKTITGDSREFLWNIFHESIEKSQKIKSCRVPPVHFSIIQIL